MLSGHMGNLYPTGLWEVLPNETVQHTVSSVIRMSPMAAPIMHPVTVRVHSFFVSMRNAWGDQCGKAFEDFITGGAQNTDTSTIPTVTRKAADGHAKGDLLDYLGVPFVEGAVVNALPLRAVNQVWNEFFRDQDLQTERAAEDVSIPAVAWEKDNFTVARPWPQKGETITLPISGQARVKGLGVANQNYAPAGDVFETGINGPVNYATAKLAGPTADSQVYVQEDPARPGYPGVYTDLSSATAVPVTELRRALALQRIAEQRARYGSRYAEYLRYSYGATPRDARLQRPEYLGGGSVSMSVREVLQTGPEQTAQRFGVGDLYGHGIGAVRSNTYRYHALEHGYIVSFLSVRPKAMYINGVDRLWLKSVRDDFFHRELQYIGQQPVLKGELYINGTDSHNRETFGWNDRYAEYRRSRSRVSGEFRSDLNYWHLGRNFAGPNAPALNEDFVKCVPDKRIFNVQTRDTLWMLVQHRMASRSVVDRSAYGKII